MSLSLRISFGVIVSNSQASDSLRNVVLYCSYDSPLSCVIELIPFERHVFSWLAIFREFSQFERIPNGRSQRFLTDVHTHKLTATLPVYPSKKDTYAASNRRSRSDKTATLFVTRQEVPGGDASVSQYNIVIVVIYNVPIKM